MRRFWLNHYAPAVLEAEARRYPAIGDIVAELGGSVDARCVPIPLNCRNGFNEAYYGRPEMLLDPSARLACSAWSFVEPTLVAEYVQHLAADLDGGTWDRNFGQLRTQPEFAGSLRLIVAAVK